MKTKSRLGSLDVRAILLELRPALEGAHLQNIYDIDSRTYLLKFAKKASKTLVLLESGVRLHSTKYGREDSNTFPSAFAAKLRKHLRDRRLTRCEQIGFDRVVHFEFGHESRPELTLHLFLELYALGNLILTDSSIKVIALLRQVVIKDRDSGESRCVLAVGDVYQQDALGTGGCLTLNPCQSSDMVASSSEGTKTMMRRCFPLFPPFLIEKCLAAATADPSTNSPVAIGNRIVHQLNSPQSRYAGQVVTDGQKWVDFYPNVIAGPEEEPSKDAPSPTATRGAVHFATFNEATDEYFYRMEQERLVERKRQQEEAVDKKFHAIKAEQEARITSLQERARDCLLKARLIEENIKLVEDACLVINTGLQNDLGWQDLQSLIVAERARGQPIAAAIRSLKLHQGLIELDLPCQQQSVPVDIDIRLGGFANSTRYYDLRKATLDKLERTRAAFEQAMRSAEAKVKADSKRERRRTQHLVAKRKPFWFEKFNWFLSSDRYLVLSGRDMHQNEYLVKRLLKPGDAYVHADLTGASSVIVKNHRWHEGASEEGQSLPPPEIPHRTLTEAGAFSLCFSKAWEAKIVTSAWWVRAEQVSKTAPSGEYLATGSFMIRGKKSFLPPAQLALGFGFMFLLDEESTGRHRTARLEREALYEQQSHDAKDSTPVEEATAKFLQHLSVSSPILEEGEEQGEIVVSETLATSKKSQAAARQNKGATAKGTATAQQQQQQQNIAPGKGNKTRGKHGKQRKLKEKYKDQDEEERQARMQLLHGLKPADRTDSLSMPRPEAPKSVALPNKTPLAPAASLPSSDGCGRNGVASLDTEQELNSSIIPATNEEDPIGPSELSVIDCLTGRPAEQDVLTGAIAVAAPFMVTQHYKYRVKLMPGNLKRGSAAKTCLSLIFSEHRASMTVRERELIRAVPDTELNTTMPSKVRIAASGVELSKVKRASKQKK